MLSSIHDSRFTIHGAQRLEGWEGRLQAVIDAAASRPYELGVHDCFRVACAVVEALTGIDRWPEFAGRYATKADCYRLLREYAARGPVHDSRFTIHGVFDAAFDWFFGAPHVTVRLARRGDIVKCVDETGEAHLGVCLGSQIAVLREFGLSYEFRHLAHHCWRVG